jgi:dUTPase
MVASRRVPVSVRCVMATSARLTVIASKHSIDTGAGVIDADYRGPVMVLLFNLSDVDFTGPSLPVTCDTG